MQFIAMEDGMSILIKEQGSLSLGSGAENISILARTKLSTYHVYRFLCETYRTIEDDERIGLFIFS